jgi:hypothetical protein
VRITLTGPIISVAIIRSAAIIIRAAPVIAWPVAVVARRVAAVIVIVIALLLGGDRADRHAEESRSCSVASAVVAATADRAEIRGIAGCRGDRGRGRRTGGGHRRFAHRQNQHGNRRYHDAAASNPLRVNISNS